MTSRPTWAEVSLSTLRNNFRAIQNYVGPNVTICAVVKADAYGHGAVECARALEAEGASWFGVTSTDEALQLRQAGVRGRILLMTGFWSGDEAAIVDQQLTPAVWDCKQLELLQGSAVAGKHKRTIPVHLKVDTGMTRLGVSVAELPALLKCLRSAPQLELEGAFTHLASAEVIGATDVDAQLKCFRNAASLVKQAGFSPAFVHAANSAAIAGRKESWENMVRPGLSLYGYYLPFTGGKPPEHPLVERVLSWKSRVISLRNTCAGQPLGYNGTFITARDSRIAVLPVGYADGLNRQLSSRGRVIIRGAYAPIVGRISMDLTLIDVTDVPGVDVGDEVVLIGCCGELSITACEHAAAASTIPYEILCNISKRVPRRYT
jgi:alanine racemase